MLPLPIFLHVLLTNINFNVRSNSDQLIKSANGVSSVNQLVLDLRREMLVKAISEVGLRIPGIRH